MESHLAAIGLAVLVFLGSAPVAAEGAGQGQSELTADDRKGEIKQGQQGHSDPERVIDEITRKENTYVGPSGATEASTGGAEPVENWFGCPPDDGKEAAPVEKYRESCADKGNVVDK